MELYELLLLNIRRRRWRLRRFPLLNLLLLCDYSMDHITNIHPSPEQRISISEKSNDQNGDGYRRGKPNGNYPVDKSFRMMYDAS